MRQLLKFSMGYMLLLVSGSARAQLSTSLAGNSGVTMTSLGQGSLVTAFGQISGTTTTVPAALANFGFAQNGILTTEAGVAASAPTTAARIFVDYTTGVTDSGVAIANPSNSAITLSVQLNDAQGNVTMCPGQRVPANGHLAMFASQLCQRAISNPFLGTLTLTSSTPFAATSLQMGTNSRGEQLYNSLPVATPNSPPAGTRLYFSQFADGAGFSTEILLMNLTSATITGTVTFFGNSGQALTMNFGASVGSVNALNYSIPGNGMLKFTTTGSTPGTPLQVGYAVVTSSSGALPSGAVVFSCYNGTGGLASVAGVLNSPLTTWSRMYTEKSYSPLTRNTGVAIVNPNNSAATVQLSLVSLDGSFTTSNTITLAANNHTAAFIDQSVLMGGAASSIPTNFQGVLTLNSNLPIAPVALRLTANQRGEDLYSTLPVVDLNNPLAGPLYLPQIADGGGYATQIILVNTSSNSATVTMTFFNDAGSMAPIAFNSAIIPQTTKPLDPQGVQSLNISANGSDLTLSTESQIGQSLAPGDVLAIGITPLTPNGLLRKVVSVSQSGSQINVTTAQATLADAFSKANFAFNTAITGQSVQTAQALRSGVRILLPRNEKKSTMASATAGSLQIPCASDVTILVEMFNAPLVQDQHGSILASGEIRVCPSVEFDWNFDGFPPKLDSLAATATLGADIRVNVTGAYQGRFDKEIPIATITSAPITVFLGPVPLILTPTVTFFVGASGDLSAGFSAGVTQTASITGGLSYNNGQLVPVFSSTNNFDVDPIGLDAALSSKAYAGVTIALAIDKIVSPEFSPDAFLQLDVNPLVNPWWTLSAGLEGDASVNVSIFGLADLADFDFPNLFRYSKTIAKASGGFVPSSAAPVLNTLTPATASAGTSGLTLAISGSNFVPGAVVKFNGTNLSTSFVSPNNLTAVLTAANLVLVGTFPVTVTNPDAPTVSSNALNFTVSSPPAPNPTPAISSLSPSSATAGSGPITLTINGSGFIASSSVTFGGAAHIATLVSSNQLTITLCTSDLSTIGSFPVVVVNPAPGGGTSNAINFNVAGATILGAGADGNLYRIEPMTGATVLIGPLPTVMSDIAAYNGVLYGISYTFGTLYRIDPNTGAGSAIGTGPDNLFLNALAFGPTGTLYAAGGGNFGILSTSTGLATIVGGSSWPLSGYACSGDIEFDKTGKLYLISSNLFHSDQLFSINPTTGEGTLIGDIGFENVYGLAYLNGTMYGFTLGGQVITINLTTGAGNSIASYSPGFYGATVF